MKSDFRELQDLYEATRWDPGSTTQQRAYGVTEPTRDIKNSFIGGSLAIPGGDGSAYEFNQVGGTYGEFEEEGDHPLEVEMSRIFDLYRDTFENKGNMQAANDIILLKGEICKLLEPLFTNSVDQSVDNETDSSGKEW